jgi:hypothetical protein
MAYKQTFDQIFKKVDDNTLEILKKIKVGSVELDPGAQLNKGVIVAGLDFFKFIGGELEGDDTTSGAFDVKLVWPA